MATLDNRLGQVRTYEEMDLVDRREVRRLLLCIDDTARKVSKLPLPAKELTDLAKWRKDLTHGRICTDLGHRLHRAGARLRHHGGLASYRLHGREKIGSSGMTYSQGIAAQITAAASIGIASLTGMPVSTTHILSAVAGTMVANKSGLQSQTIKTILMAWVLTLPLTMLLSGGLFLISHHLFS
jgi:low-affinity inorganic phosphate transporter